jgi:hypothetical protein
MMIRFKEEAHQAVCWQEKTTWEGTKKKEKETIQDEARMRLRESPYRELRDVTCDFHEGELTLQGRVPSFFLKQVAQSIVFVMERVDIINNRIDVVVGTRT